MSLQEYLLSKLSAEARTLTLDEVLDRVGERSGGRAPLDVVVEAVRAGRDCAEGASAQHVLGRPSTISLQRPSNGLRTEC